MILTEIEEYLNDYLAIRDIPDWKDAFNGLQVDGTKNIKKVTAAVDACEYTINEAVRQGADLLLVHHGLFWGAKAPVTGAYYRRLSALIKNDIALYSCHTPLDAHPEVGNNHVLARKLGLEPAGLFGEVEGVPIGLWAPTQIPRDKLIEKISNILGSVPLCIPTGPEMVRKVGIVTGGAGNWIGKAAAIGVDTFLTGEGNHHTYFDAEELGINVIYGGHYATETFGVIALAQHLNRMFGLEYIFIDHPTGL